jgi:6-phospho-beta-glucosidase
MEKRLPDNFYWGGSVTSFQMEGAVFEDGKGMSVYDTHKNKKGDPIWDVAIDFYHRYKEDIAVMKDLGINFYRFSLCWARIQPDGETAINEKGIAYYNDVINELIKNGITPMITLDHYDIPLPLQEKYNGFYSRHVVELFANFTEICVSAFGDRVKYWMTFNEQNDYAKECKKASAINVPKGMSYPKFLYQVNHNIFIAHCKVLKIIKEKYLDAQVCGMSAVTNFYPATSSPENSLFCCLADLYTNQFHNFVYTYGYYPSYMEGYLKHHGWYPEFLPEDEDLLKNTVDFLGVSYYRSYTLTTGDFNQNKPFYDVIESNIIRNKHLDITNWGWEIDATGLRYNLTSLYSRYQLPILILENGLSHLEELNDNGEIEDDYRIKYHKEHIEEMEKSIFIDGVDCFGYVCWGPFDMLSSSGDMSKRYGFIYVNRTNEDVLDLRRIKKKSYYYMQDV